MESDPCGFMTTKLNNTSLFGKLVSLLKRSGTPIWEVRYGRSEMEDGNKIHFFKFSVVLYDQLG